MCIRDRLSGQNCNVWWIVSYIGKIFYNVKYAGLGLLKSVGLTTQLVRLSILTEKGIPNPQYFATVLFLIFVFYLFYKFYKSKNRVFIFITAGLLIYGYTIISLRVHENHLFPFISIFSLVFFLHPILKRMFIVLSGVYFFNVFLFYGLGEKSGVFFPRHLFYIDSTVILAVINVLFFVYVCYYFIKHWNDLELISYKKEF